MTGPFNRARDAKAVRALATDPNARVMVFIDGQNLYKACRKFFGRPHCHPHLLAEHLAGCRTAHRPSCRFYTGRPSQNMPGQRTKLRNLDRRLAGMRRMGVTVVTRPLRYHWEWGYQAELPEPSAHAEPQTVTMTPWQRPHEKGIDLALALDVVEFCLTNKCDVAVVVSLDRDLQEIPTALRNLRGLLRHPVRLEAAVPVSDASRPKTLPGFARTHQITRAVFEQIRDDTDYTVDQACWTQPALPEHLGEGRGLRTCR